jgi:hypothetical protein
MNRYVALLRGIGEASASRLTVERTVGARMTQRNWNSILRITTAMRAD